MVFQVIGAWNVVRHVDTIKSSFNTDYADALTFILDKKANCSGTIVAFDHDPVMTYLLETAKIPVSSPFSRQGISTDMQNGDCVIQIKSNPGNFSGEELETIDDATAFGMLHLLDHRQIGRDSFYRFKHSEEGRPFNEYYLDIVVFSVTDSWHGPELLELVPGYGLRGDEISF